MNCRELIDNIDNLIEPEVSRRSLHAAHQHLDICESCRAYLSTYKQTVRLARRAYIATPPFLPADWIMRTLWREAFG